MGWCYTTDFELTIVEVKGVSYNMSRFPSAH